MSTFRAFLAAVEDEPADPCGPLVDKLRWRLDLPETFTTCAEFLAFLGRAGLGDPAAPRLWGRWLDHRHLDRRAQRERSSAGRGGLAYPGASGRQRAPQPRHGASRLKVERATMTSESRVEVRNRRSRDLLLWSTGTVAWLAVGLALGALVLAAGGGQESYERPVVKPLLGPHAETELLIH